MYPLNISLTSEMNIQGERKRIILNHQYKIVSNSSIESHVVLNRYSIPVQVPAQKASDLDCCCYPS
jgi:hypothetical protein